MYSVSMNPENKRALKRLKKVLAKELALAWENGYAESTEDHSYNYHVGYNNGVSEERERIKAIFDMNIQWALESGKGSDVVFFTKAKQIIEPVEVDYSEEAYKKSLEDDGF
jgi:hypothetical protein